MVSKRLVFLILAAGLLTSATRPGFAEKPLRLFFEKNIEAAKRPEPQTHTVREGEWLIRILEEKGYTRQEIRELLPVVKELNPDITDLNKLRPGQTLQLPDEPPATLKIRPAIPPESKKKTYTVKSGDTLVSILKREGVPQELIFKDYLGLFLELNPQISDINKLRVGQEIVLPVPGSAPAAAVPAVPDKAPANATAVAAPVSAGQGGSPGGANGTGSPNATGGGTAGPGGPAQGHGGHGAAPSGAQAKLPVQTVKPKPPVAEKPVNATEEKEEEKKPVTGLPFVRSVLEQMRFRFTPGQEALYPLPKGGWLHVDLVDSPIFDTPWGEKVIFALTPKNQEWIDNAEALGMRVCPVSPDWSLQEVLEKLTETYPQAFRLWAKDRDLVRFKDGMSITLKGPQMVVIERRLSEKAVYMLWPRQTPTEPSLPQGLPEVLSQGRIKVIELDAYNKPSRLPSRPRGSVYIPVATHTDLLQAMRLKKLDGREPQNLAELLRMLQGKDMLHQGMARAAWYSGPKSLAVQVPAWLVSPGSGKIILLDSRFSDESLISILTQAGYTCFVLPN